MPCQERAQTTPRSGLKECPMPDPDKCLRQMGRISVTVTRHSPQGDGDFPKRSGCNDRTRNLAAQFVQGWSECIFAELCKTERKRESLSQPVGRSNFLRSVPLPRFVSVQPIPRRPAVQRRYRNRERSRVARLVCARRARIQARRGGVAQVIDVINDRLAVENSIRAQHLNLYTNHWFRTSR